MKSDMPFSERGRTSVFLKNMILSNDVFESKGISLVCET